MIPPASSSSCRLTGSRPALHHDDAAGTICQPRRSEKLPPAQAASVNHRYHRIAGPVTSTVLFPNAALGAVHVRVRIARFRVFRVVTRSARICISFNARWPNSSNFVLSVPVFDVVRSASISGSLGVAAVIFRIAIIKGTCVARVQRDNLTAYAPTIFGVTAPKP